MNGQLLTYSSLIIAIVCETIATSFLKQSEQFTKLVPSLITGAAYVCCFYFLSITLKTMPVGIAYAVWSGLGIVLISLIGFFIFKQHLDTPAYIGLAMIVAGVIIINVFSKAVAH